LPEAVARNGGEEVRIAPACVKHGRVGGTLDRTAAGGLDQFVLEFERAERRDLGLFLRARLCRFCHPTPPEMIDCLKERRSRGNVSPFGRKAAMNFQVMRL